MPDATAFPGPAPDATSSGDPVSRQLAQLTDAVNRLVQHQQQPSHTPPDVGGAIPGGVPPAPSVDLSALSPVQQIALGLRDTRPVGPAGRAAVVRASGDSIDHDESGRAHAGAD